MNSYTPSELGRPAQLLERGQFGFTGFVRDDHVHVFDSFGTGLSHLDMLDQSPSYRPIALEHVVEKGDSILYLDCFEDLLTAASSSN